MPKQHGDYVTAVEKQLGRIGKANGTQLPLANDPITQAAQELAIAAIIRSQAEARYNKAKAAMCVHVPMPQSGVVHSSEYADVTCTMRNGSKTLNADKLMLLLVNKLKCDMETAQRYIDSCRVEGAKSVVYTATLKA